MGARPACVAAAIAACAMLLGACTRSHPEIINSTVTETMTHTRTPSVSAAPAATVAPLPPDQAPAKGEAERKCPYIGSNFTDPTPNAADDEGDRVYRTTVITTMDPIGCRFYFWAPPYEATADIVIKRSATAIDAHNAMVATGNAGRSAEGVPNLVPGVEAVLFQTAFYGPDGDTDWACAFAKGPLLVIVHTQRNDQADPARQFAKDIEPKIP